MKLFIAKSNDFFKVIKGCDDCHDSLEITENTYQDMGDIP